MKIATTYKEWAKAVFTGNPKAVFAIERPKFIGVWLEVPNGYGMSNIPPETLCFLILLVEASQ